MPKAQEDFQNAVLTVLEVVMFENWLRFYFISEKPDVPPDGDGQTPLFIAIPVKGMERIGELYPHLLPMAEAMNGREVTFEISRRAVCNHVLEHVDGKRIPRDMAGIVFESALFQARMQMFNTWVQVHESQLDEHFFEFGAWRKLFAEWSASPAARELEQKLMVSAQAPAPAGTRTIQ